jgi:hypothetical protein
VIRNYRDRAKSEKIDHLRRKVAQVVSESSVANYK